MNFGQTVYATHCASCHAADGLGMPPEYPPLASNPSIRMQSAVNPIRMVLNGGFPPGTAGNPMPYGMPPFAQTLSDDEVAAVGTYIRATWGNGGRRSPRARPTNCAQHLWIDAAMINSDPATGDDAASAQQDRDVNAILRSGATGRSSLPGLRPRSSLQSGSRSICLSSCRAQSRHHDALAP
jgi:cytochrome c553